MAADSPSRFIFDDAAARDGLPGYRNVPMPAELLARADVVRALDESLGSPDYAGDNWDALIDRLSDLSWLDGDPAATRIALLHAAWPGSMPTEELHKYLTVLNVVMGRLNGNAGPEVVAVFPTNARQRFEAR